MRQLCIELMSAIRKETNPRDHSVGLMDFAHEVEQRLSILLTRRTSILIGCIVRAIAFPWDT